MRRKFTDLLRVGLWDSRTVVRLVRGSSGSAAAKIRLARIPPDIRLPKGCNVRYTTLGAEAGVPVADAPPQDALALFARPPTRRALSRCPARAALEVPVNEDGLGLGTPVEAACSNSPHQIVVALAVEISVSIVAKIVRFARAVKTVDAPSASMSWTAPVAVNRNFETGGQFKVGDAGGYC